MIKEYDYFTIIAPAFASSTWQPEIEMFNVQLNLLKCSMPHFFFFSTVLSSHFDLVYEIVQFKIVQCLTPTNVQLAITSDVEMLDNPI